MAYKRMTHFFFSRFYLEALQPSFWLLYLQHIFQSSPIFPWPKTRNASGIKETAKRQSPVLKVVSWRRVQMVQWLYMEMGPIAASRMFSKQQVTFLKWRSTKPTGPGQTRIADGKESVWTGQVERSQNEGRPTIKAPILVVSVEKRHSRQTHWEPPSCWQDESRYKWNVRGKCVGS